MVLHFVALPLRIEYHASLRSYPSVYGEGGLTVIYLGVKLLGLRMELSNAGSPPHNVLELPGAPYKKHFHWRVVSTHRGTGDPF